MTDALTTLAPTAPLTEGWRMPHLSLPIQRKIDHQFRLAVAGVESTVLEGRKGWGKTTAVRNCCRQFEQEEMERELNGATGEPRRQVLWQRASTAEGRKTALVDLYTTVVGRGSTRLRQSFTPADLIEAIVDECCTQNVRVLVIDEAQKIDAANHDQVRQLLDAARAREHTMGIILIGTVPLRDIIISNGEMGQRYAGYLTMEPITTKELIRQLETLHPDLAPLRQQIGEPAWQLLISEIVRVTGGSVRRLESILENAHAFARRKNSVVTLTFMEAAIDKLAKEA